MENQLTQATPVKEELSFEQTRSDTKTSRTNKKGDYNLFHCGDPNHRVYKSSKLYEKDTSKLVATKEKGGRVNIQVFEVVEDNKYS